MIAYISGDPFNYVDLGPSTAMPVVFIHGFPFDHEMWRPQLDAVSKTHRAIAYDLRGHGMSFVGDGQFTIEGHVNDLLGLLDSLNISRCVVAGLSMGGYIALRALERNPERFSAAVLCDTRSEADGNEGKLKRFSAVANVKKNGSIEFAKGFVQVAFAPQSFATRAEAIQRITKTIEHTPPLSIAGTQLALASRTDTTGSLANIAVPTLILVGENDTITPPTASQAMHEKIPGSKLHIIPNAGHVSNLENPEEFNRHLLVFLKQVQPLHT